MFETIKSYSIAFASAASLLVATVIIQNSGSTELLVKWSVFASLVSISITPGLFGIEQMIYKYSEADRGMLLIERRVIHYIIFALIISMTMLYLINLWAYSLDKIFIYALPFIGALSVLASTIFKSFGNAHGTILLKDAWKALLLLSVIMSTAISGVEFINLFIMTSVIIYALAIIKIAKKIRFVDQVNNDSPPHKSDRDYLTCFFTYALGVAIVLFMSNFDRIAIITSRSDDFTGYFLLVTYLFTPLTIVSSAFGAIWASRTRVGMADYEINRIWLLSGLVGATFITIGYLIIENCFDFNINLTRHEIFCLGLLLIARFQYMCTTSMSIFQIEITSLLKINIKFSFIAMPVVIFGLYTVSDFGINLLLLGAMWHYRSFVMTREIRVVGKKIHV